ncbi:MAG: LamG domain-containing protein [Limisphaerales bacterium]
MKFKLHPLPNLLAIFYILTIAVPSAHADYASTVESFNPLAYWRFDETVATPPLNTVSNYGTLGGIANGYAMNNATKGQPGIVSNSIRFSNPGNVVGLSSNKVEIPYNPALNSIPFSVEFWAKPNSLGNDSAGFCPVSSLDPNWYPGNRSGWLFYVNNTGVWSFRLGNTGGSVAIINGTNGNAHVGSWQHIVATFDGTNAIVYANGVVNWHHDKRSNNLCAQFTIFSANWRYSTCWWKWRNCSPPFPLPATSVIAVTMAGWMNWPFTPTCYRLQLFRHIMRRQRRTTPAMKPKFSPIIRWLLADE